MTASLPPGMATWLLKHLGCAADNDAVMGDLAERYSNGKSGVWYWRQVVVAIVESAFNDIRHHKLLALRALIIGWGIFYPLGALSFDALAFAEKRWSPEWVYSAITAWTPWWNQKQFTGLYWNSDLVVGSLMMLAIGTIPGWIVAKIHRPHQRSLLLLFSATVLMSWINYAWTASASDIGASPYWEAYFWMNNSLQAAGVVIGGLLIRQRKLSAEGS